MDSIPDDLLLYTFHCLDLYDMPKVRKINRTCRTLSKEYSLPSNRRISGSLHHWSTCFPKLKTANIKYRPTITPEELIAIRHVEVLDMSFCTQRLPDNMFSTFSNLKVLDIQHCCKSWSGFTDKCFAHLTGLTELRLCDNHYLSDDGIGQLVNLEILYIHSCIRITNAGLSPLTKLTHLNLYHMDLLTDDLFKSFVHLTRLDMTFGKISTVGITHLTKLTHLTVMGCANIRDLQGCQHLPLQKVDVTYCCITDDDMKHISHASTVTFYDTPYIIGSRFSDLTNVSQLSVYKLCLDDSVLNVSTLKKLKVFNMYDCRVLYKIKQQLAKAFPMFHTD